MSDTLQRILTTKREEVARAKAGFTPSDLDRRINLGTGPRGFKASRQARRR